MTALNPLKSGERVERVPVVAVRVVRHAHLLLFAGACIARHLHALTRSPALGVACSLIDSPTVHIGSASIVVCGHSPAL